MSNVVPINPEKHTYYIYLKSRKAYMITTVVPPVVIVDAELPKSSFLTFYKSADRTKNDIMAMFNSDTVAHMVRETDLGDQIFEMAADDSSTKDKQ